MISHEIESLLLGLVCNNVKLRTKIESDIAGDLVIEFGEEYRLKLLCVSSNASLFSVYYKNEIFEYLPKGIWVKLDSEKINKLTSEEERISDHAYDCYERWSKIVPNEVI